MVQDGTSKKGAAWLPGSDGQSHKVFEQPVQELCLINMEHAWESKQFAAFSSRNVLQTSVQEDVFKTFPHATCPCHFLVLLCWCCCCCGCCGCCCCCCCCCCWLLVVGCLLFVVCCLLFVVCCLLFVVVLFLRFVFGGVLLVICGCFLLLFLVHGSLSLFGVVSYFLLFLVVTKTRSVL